MNISLFLKKNYIPAKFDQLVYSRLFASNLTNINKHAKNRLYLPNVAHLLGIKFKIKRKKWSTWVNFHCNSPRQNCRILTHIGYF
ncbi:hypothetical protein VCRLGP7_480044 [Vibrio crassostreae]|nr:hypothetical protein VCRLGP7_480044 [Vibrio crassostreae]